MEPNVGGPNKGAIEESFKVGGFSVAKVFANEIQVHNWTTLEQHLWDLVKFEDALWGLCPKGNMADGTHPRPKCMACTIVDPTWWHSCQICFGLL